MAVQILAYEVRVAYLDRQQANAPVEEEEEAPYPLVDDLERFYQHLEQVCLIVALSARPIRARL